MASRRKTIDVAGNQFYKLDKWILAEKSLKKLSPTAKLLYVILKDREELSLKNAEYFTDKEGYLFQYFDQENASDLLGVSLTAIKKAFKDLQEYKLIESVRQGQGKPNRLYILNYEVSEDTLKELSYEMKKTSTDAPVEVPENHKNLNLNKNNSTNNLSQNKNNGNGIKCKKEFNPNYNKSNVRRNSFNNGTNNTFTNYEPDELEKLLFESQKGKFK